MDAEEREAFERLTRKIDTVDRKTDSIRQTMDEVVRPQLADQHNSIEKLKTRYVYALTIIGTSVTVALGLAVKGVLG